MSKKNECFETLRNALIVRKKVTEILRVLALQTQKRLETLISVLATATEDKREEIQNQIREERFNFWLIKEECSLVASKGADLTGSLRTANTIFPTYLSEFTERRVFMDRALSACNVLQDELKYIAEAVYADKNKFTALVLEIDALFKKIKSVRQADNRFLKELRDVNQKV